VSKSAKSSNTLHSRSVSISYSHPKSEQSHTKRVSIDVDESLILTLVSSNRRNQRLRSEKLSERLSLKPVSSKTKSKNKKNVRFNDNVIIHTIEYEKPKTVNAMNGTYVLVVTLREIWSQLDIDQDGYLNIAELKNFCYKVWEEADVNVHTILDFYAKVDKIKGMNFHEWCSLVQDEDPKMESFVDDLYDIFVDPSVYLMEQKSN